MGILRRQRRWRRRWLGRKFDDCRKSEYGIALDGVVRSVVFGGQK